MRAGGTAEGDCLQQYFCATGTGSAQQIKANEPNWVELGGRRKAKLWQPGERTCRGWL
jgi:hypothetical protein